MADFATHYNTTVVPARPAKPQDKSGVENEVNLMYQRVKARLRNTQFFSRTELNKAIAEKVREHNQTRMQQKPYCREERFLSEEQKHLQPLPQERFELKYYHELTVQKNNHIYLAENKHYYSVPYTLVGKRVRVIYTRSMVRIYHAGAQVAVHIRSYQEGTYTTVKDHLCSHHQHYLDRSPAYYLGKGQKHSTVLYDLMEALFQQPDKHPEQLYRTCPTLRIRSFQMLNFAVMVKYFGWNIRRCPQLILLHDILKRFDRFVVHRGVSDVGFGDVIFAVGMYFKFSGRINPSSGRNEPYLRLVESYRNSDGRVCHRTILHIGFADEPVTPEQLNQISRLLTARYEHKIALFEHEDELVRRCRLIFGVGS